MDIDSAIADAAAGLRSAPVRISSAFRPQQRAARRVELRTLSQGIPARLDPTSSHCQAVVLQNEPRKEQSGSQDEGHAPEE